MALVLFVPAALRTGQLYARMKSDIEELLPRESKSVVAVDELRARLEGMHYLAVVIDAGDAARLPAAERFIDDLAARVAGYPKDLIRAARKGDAEERRFLEEHAPLYVDLEDLQTVHARVTARRDWEVSHKLGTALDDDEPAPPLDFNDLRKKYESRVSGRPRHPNDRFTDVGLHATLLLLQVSAPGIEEAKGVLRRVKADVQSLDPNRYAPGMRIGYAGDIAISVEETEALMADLSFASVVVVLAVLAALVAYYRWWRSVLLLFPPLFVATALAFATASLGPFGVTELNSNTAFLGSIIVGNGINFGIILLARYVEERRNGVATHEALVIAVRGSRAGTFAAALAASVSYASLMATQFRGFRQFGIIGGIGMIYAWLFAYLLMPPLVAWIDKDEKSAPPVKREATSLVAWVARGVQRAPLLVAIVCIAVTVFAGLRVRHVGSDQLETDFGKLRRADTAIHGERYWSKYLDTILGEYLTPIVVLTDDPATARSVSARVREASQHPPLLEFVASVRTIDDVLPREQTEKIAEVKAIRAEITPKMRSLLTDEQRKELDRFLGDEVKLVAFAAHELPKTFTTGMMEREGTVGRTVLIYPRFNENLWKGDPLRRFVSEVRALVAEGTSGRPTPRVAGSLAVSSDILDSISHDGPIASMAALLGVVVVVLLVFRGDGTTWWVIGSLVAGVIWLGAAMMVAKVKINFANFIAFPITFGIGVDYAVNVMSRHVQDGRRDVAQAVKSVGSAVALCSVTTIVGYSSLLLAENRALYLFGWVAVMGEIACLTTAIVALPAILLVIARWSRRPTPAP